MKHNHLLLPAFLCVVSSCMLDSGTHGSMEKYSFNYSKETVSKALQLFEEQHPEYIVPQSRKSLTWHYGSRNTADKWIKEANADSISFSFYFKDENVVVWAQFDEFSKDWDRIPCVLSLIGYIDVNGGKWQFEDNSKKEQKNRISRKFNTQIIEKLQEDLKPQE